MASLSGTIFGGAGGLGIFDFLSSSNNDSNFTSCPAGSTYQYSPSTNTGKCVPDAGTTVNVGGQQVTPTTQPDGCITGFTYVKRADGTGSCVAKANVTTTSSTWGTTTYKPGGDSYNPSGSTVCPKGTVWDPVKGQCGKGTCPAGTVRDPINGTCDKVAGSGGGGGKAPSPAPPTPAPPPVESAGISPVAIVAGVLAVGALAAVVYKVRKNKMKSNAYGDCDDEEC